MATAGVPLWSTSAASNASADPAVNWAEGQSPSSVNDSARGMMASIAKWRDDLYGLTTSGSSTAFTVTSNATYATAAAMSGAVFTIIPHTTSGAAPTLSVDGLTARALNVSTGSPILTGALVSGTPYFVKYVHATTEFIVIGAVRSDGTPIGQGADFFGSTAPAGWIFAYGQAISRTTYAALYAVIGDAYGAGDGSTTFNVPDKRGRFSAGKDNMGGSAASRLTSTTMSPDGVTLGATGGAQTVVLTQGNLPSVNLTTTIAAGQGAHTHNVPELDVNGPTGGLLNGASSLSNTRATSSATLPEMTGTTPLGGSATGVNKLPPTIVCNYIIFAGV